MWKLLSNESGHIGETGYPTGCMISSYSPSPSLLLLSPSPRPPSELRVTLFSRSFTFPTKTDPLGEASDGKDVTVGERRRRLPKALRDGVTTVGVMIGSGIEPLDIPLHLSWLSGGVVQSVLPQMAPASDKKQCVQLLPVLLQFLRDFLTLGTSPLLQHQTYTLVSAPSITSSVSHRSVPVCRIYRYPVAEARKPAHHQLSKVVQSYLWGKSRALSKGSGMFRCQTYHSGILVEYS